MTDKPRSAIWIDCPWSGQGAGYPDAVLVAEHDTHSRLLDASGRPMAYEKPPVGFDLMPKKGNT